MSNYRDNLYNCLLLYRQLRKEVKSNMRSIQEAIIGFKAQLRSNHDLLVKSNINVIGVQKITDILINKLQEKYVDFHLSHYEIYDDEYVLYIEVLASYDTIIEITRNFDSQICESELFDESKVVNVILLKDRRM